MELSEEARVNRASYPDYYLQVRTGPGTGGDWEWYLRYRNVEILVSTYNGICTGPLCRIPLCRYSSAQVDVACVGIRWDPRGLL